MLKTDLMKSWTRPVYVGVMRSEPGESQEEWVTRRGQDMKLDILVMVARQEHVDRHCLVSDSPYEVTVQAIGGNSNWQAKC